MNEVSISKAMLKAVNNNKNGVLETFRVLKLQGYKDCQICRYILKHIGVKNMCKNMNNWQLGQVAKNLQKLCI